MKKSYLTPLFEAKEIKIVAVMEASQNFDIDAGGDVNTNVGNEQ